METKLEIIRMPWSMSNSNSQLQPATLTYLITLPSAPARAIIAVR